MILHLSIGAKDPKRVASVIAELWGGRALPCPHPIEGGWIAFADDDEGTAVEVYPLGHALVPGAAAVTSRAARGASLSGPTATHFAMLTRLSQARVEGIAAREGWRAAECDRGPYRVIELWLEGERLVEVLTAQMHRDYVATMTPKQWEEMF
jgi:hypothetical protein